jgi:Family of unknown function (DUF6603)
MLDYNSRHGKTSAGFSLKRVEEINMDMQQLQALVNITNQRLDLRLADLLSAQVSQAFGPFCADGILHVRNVAIPVSTTTSITLSGIGDAVPFLNMPLTLVFTLTSTQDAAVSLTATAPAGWTLQQSFPILNRSIFDLLTFASSPAPTLTLDSTIAIPPAEASQSALPTDATQSTDASQPLVSNVSAMTFTATLAPPSPLTTLSFLLGDPQLLVSGILAMSADVPDAPQIILPGSDVASVNLDFLKLTNVGYALYCDPVYNTFSMEWQVDCYLNMFADITFSAQNKDYTITIAADVYDPASDIQFVADITEGIEAALDEFSALVNRASLAPPADWLKVANNVSLTDLIVSINPTGGQKINYLALKLETVEEWSLIPDQPDLLALQAIDLNVRVDSPLSSPQISGSVSGLIGIGDTGTLELTAFFGEFAFGGAMRAGDPLSLQDVFEHFLSVSDTNLPQVNLSRFDFYVEPATETYSADIELVELWTLSLGNGQTLAIDSANIAMNHPGKGEPTIFDAQGWLTIAGVRLYISARYGGPSEGWTFSGTTGPGQAIPIGMLITDIGSIFDAVTFPSVLANLNIENLSLTFNTLTNHFAFTCGSTLIVDNTPVSLSILIDVLPSGKTHTKTFGGIITVGTRQFQLHFSQDTTSTSLIATYSNQGGETIKIKEDLIAPISSSVAQFIPEGLEIDFKDVLFVFSKSAPAQDSTSITSFLFGLGIGVDIPSLSHLPLVGKELPADQTIKVNDLRVLVASSALTQNAVGGLNALIPAGVTTLPGTDLSAGLTLSASITFGSTPQVLAVPVAGAGPTNTATGTAPAASSAAGVTATDNVKWFTLQKSFGPVHFNRVGMKYEDGVVSFLLDASLTVAGLTLSLDGLSFGSPLSKFEPKFDLRGLGLDYQASSAAEVGGAFLRTQGQLPDGTMYDEYDGLAIIKSEKLTLSAIGSYAILPAGPSLFIYAVLDYPLGGPSFFFITGLAAGFGYNRSLIVPSVDQVAQFPLVSEAINGASPPQNTNDLTKELQKLDSYIPPEVGEIFFAIGIKYTSFKIIDSFVLLTVAFGNELEIDVLGLSTMILPTPVPGEPPVTPLAVVQMALKASFIPAQGFLGVSAQLTSASYLLSSACRLTGGFAFYTWFTGEHSGDFVQTLGGYHPSFNIPNHYPRVPRLGYNWPVDDQLNIKGDGYCALTASLLMAGMSLQATWNSGDLRAWFNVSVDFIIGWKPFHYDATAHAGIGVSYTFSLAGSTHHLSFDVGADLHIWGPDFSGTAHIDLDIISFDVSFGNSSAQQPPQLDWGTFKKSFLPDDNAVCGISVTKGLVSKQASDATDLGVINAKDFTLLTNSVIPSNGAHIYNDLAVSQLYYTESGIQAFSASSANGTLVQSTSGAQTKPLGLPAIGPMGVQASALTSTHTIAITRKDAQGNGNNVEHDFAYTPILKKMPVGLWGSSDQGGLNGAFFVNDALAGFEIKPAVQATPGETAPIDRSKLQFDTETITAAYSWTQNPLQFQADTALNDLTTRSKRISDSLADSSVATTRQQLCAAFGISAAAIDVSQASTIVGELLDVPQVKKA